MEPNDAKATRFEPSLVSDLSKSAQVLTQIHDYIDFFSRAAEKPFATPAPTVLLAHGFPLARAALAVFHLFHRIVILRTATLLADVVRSLNDSRLLDFALASRAVMETAAVAAYQGPRLVIPADATSLPSDYNDRLRSAVMASRFNWQDFFADDQARQALIDRYDAAKDWKELWPENTATNVLTMLEDLAVRISRHGPKARGRVFHDYSLLSDLCHPAAGSYLLFIKAMEPNMRAELVAPRITVLVTASLILPCVGYSALSVIEVLAEMEGVEAQLIRLDDPHGRSTAA